MFCDGMVECSLPEQTTSTMHLNIKCHTQATPLEITMDVVPSDTIGAIATRLEEITGAPSDRLSVITGLILDNPSGSYKKLDKSVSVSDHGLRDGSTLMVFVPVSQQNSSDIVVATPQPAPKSRDVCVGKAKYRPSPSEPIKTGDIMNGVNNATGKPYTKVLFNGVEYANAQDWLAKAFNNSGRSCSVKIERSQAGVVDTPRPRRYVPPSSKCPFERYI
jgi:hypothetical protein